MTAASRPFSTPGKPAKEAFRAAGDPGVLAVTCGLAAAGAVFDLLTPLGVMGGVTYVVFILSALWWRPLNAPLAFAALASGLTIFGFPRMLQDPDQVNVELLNRGLSILILWVVAFVIRYQKRTGESLRNSEAKLRAFQDGTVDGIITIDAAGIVDSYNAACERIFGFSAEEVVGQSVSMLMPQAYRADHDRRLKDYLETGQAKIIGIGREMRGQHKNGSDFPMEISVSEVRTETKLLFSGIVRDITGRKRAEREREEMIARLERSNRELDSFAYVASHDLKAPLRVIDNASRWLEEDLEGQLDEDSLENLQLLRSRVKRMEKLLDDLLEYSRIGRSLGGDSPDMVRGDQLIREALLLSDVPEGFRIATGPGFPEAELPRMPLIQVFSNLINNALKHHDKKAGTVRLSMRSEGRSYFFTVADDGPGIAPEFHGRIFKMFTTLQPRDRVEGSGMGLAMVSKTLELLGQEITLDSAPGRGSAFTFSWPREAHFLQPFSTGGMQ